MDCMTASVTPNCTASNDKVIDELKRVWKGYRKATRVNKKYNHKKGKTVKFIYERAPSWDEDKGLGWGMKSSDDIWTELWIKQIELIVHILVHKITNEWNQFSFSSIDSPPVDQGLLSIEASRSHSGTSHSVGLLCSCDQPDAEASTWHHTTPTRDRHLYSRRDSSPQSQQASGRRPTP